MRRPFEETRTGVLFLPERSSQRFLQLAWGGQWRLNAWPNFAITIVLLGMILYLAWRRGFSPLPMISPKADETLVSTLRVRFGPPGN